MYFILVYRVNDGKIDWVEVVREEIGDIQLFKSDTEARLFAEENLELFEWRVLSF